MSFLYSLLRSQLPILHCKYRFHEVLLVSIYDSIILDNIIALMISIRALWLSSKVKSLLSSMTTAMTIWASRSSLSKLAFTVVLELGVSTVRMQDAFSFLGKYNAIKEVALHISWTSSIIRGQQSVGPTACPRIFRTAGR